MNRSTFVKVAAALGVAGGLCLPASAQMQGIIAPGTLIPGQSLSKGTITYSNQTGTRDSFSVGMSTNMGANVSASSTADYNSSGTALFGLTGTSNLRQEIGTSRTTDQSYSQLSSYQNAASSSATTAALAATSTTYSTENLNAVAALSGTDTRTVNGKVYTATNKSEITNDRVNSAEYKNAYSSAYESAYTAAASSSYGSGVISGTFEKNAGKTVQSQVTSGSTAITADVKTAAESTARTQTEATYGADWDHAKNKSSYSSEAEWTTAKTNAYNTAYSGAVNTLAKGSVVSTTEQTAATTNEVEVRGVGSASNLTTSSTTKFEAAVIRPTTLPTAASSLASGTASASAGGSLSSSSYADANSTTFTSSFVQAY